MIIQKQGLGTMEHVPPVGRFLIATAAAVSRLCRIAPLILGVAVMGLTVACFVLMAIGSSGIPVTLGICMIGGIILIVLTDYLPALLNAIASRWIPKPSRYPSPLTEVEDTGENTGVLREVA